MSSSPVTPMQVSSSPPKPKSKRNNTNKMATGRQSLNDMLNFSLPPRQTHVQSIPRRSRKTGNQQGIWNKESEWYSCVTPPISMDRDWIILSWSEFVNAQYRFVMRPSGDYTVHFADPDMYVITIYDLHFVVLSSFEIHLWSFFETTYYFHVIPHSPPPLQSHLTWKTPSW